MAGISSRALNTDYAENKKKYNGIEFDNDLDLNAYEANFRDLDPQIGRWWQIDPKIEHMEEWSPFASNYDNPIRFNDPLGDAPDSSGKPEASNGGNILKKGLKAGGIIIVAGGGPEDVPADAVAGVVVFGSAIVAGGAWLYDQAVNDENSDNIDNLKGKPVPDDQIVVRPEDKIDRGLLDPPTKPGNAPTFKDDGTSVELHHVGQNPAGPYKEMHWKDHRGKGNDKINHPDKSKPSKIDRQKMKKDRESYWKSQFPDIT